MTSQNLCGGPFARSAVTAIIALFIAAPVFAQSGPNVTCTTPSSIFNTAYNGATALAPNGPPNTVRDSVWTAAVGDNTGTVPTSGFISAFVTGNAVPAAWVSSPFANADWISYYSDAEQGGSSVDLYYEYDFVLDPSVVVASFTPQLQFFADNAVVDVYVNGVSQHGQPNGAAVLPQGGGTDNYNYQGYASGKGATITLTNSWVTGQNKLVVWVESGTPETGFLTQVTGTDLCAASPVRLQDFNVE